MPSCITYDVPIAFSLDVTMKRLFLLALLFAFSTTTQAQAPRNQRPPVAVDDEAKQQADYILAHYTKYEYMVPMRDGKKLFTSIYRPKDDSRPYPFMLMRTPYSVGPYGIDKYKTRLGPSAHFDKGEIFCNYTQPYLSQPAGQGADSPR